VTCVNAANLSDHCSIFPLKTNIPSQSPVLLSDKFPDSSTGITAHLQNSATRFSAAPEINGLQKDAALFSVAPELNIYPGLRRILKGLSLIPQSKSTIDARILPC